MKRGLGPSGFTIVETMIFLAVSVAILASALSLVGRSQNKNMFTQAINEVNQEISTMINNVANGYYPRTASLSCSVLTNRLDIRAGTDARGTSKDCVLIGRVAQFLEDEDYFDIYSVAGARETGGVTRQEVTTMTEAKATVDTLSGAQRVNLKNGLRIERVRIVGGNDIGAFGVFSSFGKVTDGQLESENLTSDFAGLPNSNLTTDNVATSIESTSTAGFRAQYDAPSSAIKNPAGGIELCFRSGTNDEVGVITIGGNNRTATTSLVVRGAC